MLIIFHSICTGSVDGHCQAVDVFRGSSQTPIWHRQYAGVLDIKAVTNGFAVRAVSYGAQDPLCCPSLPAVTDTFTWTGAGFRESGPLPKPPTG